MGQRERRAEQEMWETRIFRCPLWRQDSVLCQCQQVTTCMEHGLSEGELPKPWCPELSLGHCSRTLTPHVADSACGLSGAELRAPIPGA